MLLEKQKELDTAKSEVIKFKEVADRANKVSQSNSELVTRKCALEALNSQKDRTIAEQLDKIAKYEALLNKNNLHGATSQKVVSKPIVFAQAPTPHAVSKQKTTSLTR
jgi:hypothetical protein